MHVFSIAFVVGVLTLSWFSVIPSPTWFLTGFVLLGLCWRFSLPRYRKFFGLIGVGLLGCGFVLFYSQQILKWELPRDLETKTVDVVGTIATLPKIENDDGTAQFEFILASINNQPQRVRIQLSWYHYSMSLPPYSSDSKGLGGYQRGESPSRRPNLRATNPLDYNPSDHNPSTSETMGIHAGDRWQFQVRLKRPHGLQNPGGFDYEKWLFSKEIRATGYVVNAANAKRLESSIWHQSIDRIREHLQRQIQMHLQDQPTAGLIAALVMGAQNGITQDQWRVMRATGTNHLMAIAGVHIAFISGFIYALTNFLWRRSSRLSLKLPATQAAACSALIAAIIYSALAGFALPTQRALIMLSVFMVGLFFRRELNAWSAFLLALLLVVVLEPLSTLSISFWLSFGAVFAIIYGVSGRIKPRGLWWKYGRVQWVITVALIPITIALFQQSSLISFVANLIAVPAVGIFVLPLCLVGAFLASVFPAVSHWILWLAAKGIGVIWQVLAWLGNLQGAVWHQAVPSSWALVATVVGVLLLIAPRGLPVRGLSVFWLTPLFFSQPAVPAPGIARFTLLDVGQGLSAVVQTQHHALVFDTGPPMGKHDDAGTRVILPFLQAVGISKIDTLVVSHGDSDHIGGAFTLLEEMPVQQILSSVPYRFLSERAKACQAGQTWEWDGVTFRMLYPTFELLGQKNNSSCVLRIETSEGAILLTGDIESPAEAYLVGHTASVLPATVLVAPHHGSKTSSTPDFVNAVKPACVLFPTGYKNRYRFPNEVVVERYQQIKAGWFNTSSSGAVMFDLGGLDHHIMTQRQLGKAIWHQGGTYETSS